MTTVSTPTQLFRDAEWATYWLRSHTEKLGRLKSLDREALLREVARIRSVVRPYAEARGTLQMEVARIRAIRADFVSLGSLYTRSGYMEKEDRIRIHSTIKKVVSKFDALIQLDLFAAK